MIHLLRKAVVTELASAGRASFGFSFWHSFNESDWSRAMDWLDASGLALYFWHKVKKVNAVAALPVYVQTRLGMSYEENCLRVQAITEESATLKRLFDEAGVQHAVLKGFALVPDYCPDPTLRTQHDHDYLIHPDALTRAGAVLQTEGYKPKVSREKYHITYFPREADEVPFQKPVGFYSARLERPIELHVCLWNHAEEKIAIQLPEDFLDRACRRRWEGREFQALSDEDRLTFQVLHAFRHILHNWCRLSIFLEISHFLEERASDSGFWMRFQDRTKSLRWIPEASAVVFTLAHKLFGVSAPAELTAQVSPKFSAIIDLWIDLYGLSGALVNFQNNKSSLFIHREFVDDRPAWTKVWRHRLFPLRRPHHFPNILLKHGPTGLERVWYQSFHALQRFKFHARSVVGYAWEYPRWRILRTLRTHDQPGEASRGGKVKADQRAHDSELSAEPLLTQFNKASVFRS